MKKIVSFLIAIVMVMGLATVTNATKSSELANKLYEIGKPYGFTTANKVSVERYLSENEVSDKVADKIIAKAKEVVDIFEEADASKYSQLSENQKERVKSIANEVAGMLGLTLKFGTKSVEIYKNGKLIETAYYDGSKLVYTGNNVNTILVVSSAVVIALVAGFAIRKKFANA